MQGETKKISEEVLAALGHGDFDFRQGLFKAVTLFDNGAIRLTIPFKYSDNKIKEINITVEYDTEEEPKQQQFI